LRRWLDIFKTTSTTPAISIKHGDGIHDVTFSSASNQQPLCRWGCGFLDYDNDGCPIHADQRTRLSEIESRDIGQTFKNPAFYKNLATGIQRHLVRAGPGISSGFPAAARPSRLRQRWYVDVLILNMTTCFAAAQRRGNLQNWIKIKLIGTSANRTAIGPGCA